jgi:hypothetical protein
MGRQPGAPDIRLLCECVGAACGPLLVVGINFPGRMARVSTSGVCSWSRCTPVATKTHTSQSTRCMGHPAEGATLTVILMHSGRDSTHSFARSANEWAPGRLLLTQNDSFVS